MKFLFYGVLLYLLYLVLTSFMGKQTTSKTYLPFQSGGPSDVKTVNPVSVPVVETPVYNPVTGSYLPTPKYTIPQINWGFW